MVPSDAPAGRPSCDDMASQIMVPQIPVMTQRHC